VDLFVQAISTEPYTETIKVLKEIKHTIEKSGKLNDLISSDDVDTIYVNLKNQKTLEAISDDKARGYVAKELLLERNMNFSFQSIN
jgi:hypothetical protein